MGGNNDAYPTCVVSNRKVDILAMSKEASSMIEELERVETLSDETWEAVEKVEDGDNVVAAKLARELLLAFSREVAR